MIYGIILFLTLSFNYLFPIKEKKTTLIFRADIELLFSCPLGTTRPQSAFFTFVFTTVRLVNRFTSLRLFDTRERRKQTRGGEAPPDPPFDPSFGKQHKRELRKGLYAPAGPSGRPLNRVFDSAVKTLPPSVLLLFTSAGKIQPPKTREKGSISQWCIFQDT